MKKLFRSKNEKLISGVCGGIATYFNVVSLISASIPGVLIYIICTFIIPEEPDAFDTTGQYKE